MLRRDRERNISEELNDDAGQNAVVRRWGSVQCDLKKPELFYAPGHEVTIHRRWDPYNGIGIQISGGLGNVKTERKE